MNAPVAKCCAPVSAGSFRSYPCGNPAKTEVNGKHYCGLHDPVRVKARADERSAQRRAEWGRESAQRKSADAARREIERRAACFDSLLAALNGMCSVWQTVCNSKGWEPGHVVQFTKAQAAIKAATPQGEQT